MIRADSKQKVVLFSVKLEIYSKTQEPVMKTPLDKTDWLRPFRFRLQALPVLW